MHLLIRSCRENLLVWVTICLIAGSSAAFVVAPVTTDMRVEVIALVLFLLLAGLALALPTGYRPLSTLPLFFVIGCFHTHHALQPLVDPYHIDHHIHQKTEVTLVGRIVSMVEFDGEKTRFEVAVEEILPQDIPREEVSFEPIRGKVILTVPEAIDPTYMPGMKIMALSTLDRIRNYQTPGAFNYRLQMATRSITCSAWVDSAKELLPVQEPPRSWAHRIRFLPEQMRQQVARFLEARLDRQTAGIYQALLVGSRVNIPPPLLEGFKASGCMHLLAISGLHLSLLGLITTSVFIFLLKRSQWLLNHAHIPALALAITAPLLFFYAFIAGMNIPAIRALATAILVLLAVILRRQRSLIHLIAGAALIVLTLQPLALFTASFQLSFAAVLAIITIYPRLPQVLLPEQDRKTAIQSRKFLLKAALSMFFVSLAATIGTLPFMLFHFNRFSLIGPVMNILIEPLLCFWALPWGLAALPFLSAAPILATLFLHIGAGGIWLGNTLIATAVQLPWASVWTITPHILEIVIFFIIVLLILTRQINGWQTFTAILLSTGLLASFTFTLWNPFKGKGLTVTFLDVGQGTSTLLELPDGKNVLIDGGGNQSEQFNVGQAVIAPFLWSRRIWRLDDMVISHPHRDHYNGLPFLYDRFSPQRLIVNGDTGDEPEYREFMERVQRRETAVVMAKAGDTVREGEKYTLHCLGINGLTEQKLTLSTNDRSLVLRLSSGSRSFLFPADIGLASETRLVTQPVSLRSDVLLAPHHGSITSGSKGFIDAVSPVVIVVSASGSRHGIQPATQHVEEWTRRDIPSLVTARHGAITFRTNGTDLRATTFSRDRLHADDKNMTLVQAGTHLHPR